MKLDYRDRLYFRNLAIAVVGLSLAVPCPTVAWQQHPDAEVRPLSPDSNDIRATQLAVRCYPKWHFTHRRIDEELYRRTLDRMLCVLDPNGLFFSDADVRRLREDTTLNVSAFEQGSPEFAYQLANLWHQRISQQLPWIIELANRPPPARELDYSVEFPSAAVSFAANRREVQQRCRAQIQFEQRLRAWAGASLSDILSGIINRYRGLLPGADADYQLDVRTLLLDALAYAYDPQSRYLSPEYLCYSSPRRHRLEVGIGVSLAWRRGCLTVEDVLSGGAACRDGRLQPGDRILGFAPDNSGNIVLPLEVQDINRGISLAGEAGTEVRPLVLPRGDSRLREYRIVRAEENASEFVTGTMIAGVSLPKHQQLKLGYVRLSNIYLEIDDLANLKDPKDSASRDLKDLLTDFKSEGVDVVLLDLRNCNAGSLYEMLNVAGLFLGDRPVIQAYTDDDEGIQDYAPDNATIEWDGPLVVLTSRRTRTVGEVLAGALVDYDRGLLVGPKATRGEGAVRTCLDLASSGEEQQPELYNLGSAVVSCTALFRPGGQSIQAHGVASHLVLPSMDSDVLSDTAQFAIDSRFESVMTSKSDNSIDQPLLRQLETKSRIRRSKSAYFLQIEAGSQVVPSSSKLIIPADDRDTSKTLPQSPTVPRDEYLQEAFAIAFDYAAAVR